MSGNTRLLERMQIASGFVPIALTTARIGNVVSIKNYGRIGVLFFKGIGTPGDDPTLTIEQGTDIAFSTNKALTFADIWIKMAPTNLSNVPKWTRITRTGAGITNTFTDTDSAEQAALWWVEFMAEDFDLAGGFHCLRASVSDVGTNAQLGCVLYFGGDPRYAAAPENMQGMVAG